MCYIVIKRFLLDDLINILLTSGYIVTVEKTAKNDEVKVFFKNNMIGRI